MSLSVTELQEDSTLPDPQPATMIPQQSQNLFNSQLFISSRTPSLRLENRINLIRHHSENRKKSFQAPASLLTIRMLPENSMIEGSLRMSKNTFDRFDEDLHIRILQYLPRKSILKVAFVSKSMRQFVEGSNSLWRRVALNEFPQWTHQLSSSTVKEILWRPSIKHRVEQDTPWHHRFKPFSQRILSYPCGINSFFCHCDELFVASDRQFNITRLAVSCEDLEDARSFKGNEHRVTTVIPLFDDTGPTQLLTTSFDQTLRVFDMDSMKPVRCLKGHKGIVWSAVQVKHSDVIASGGEDSTLRFWSVQSSKELTKPMTHHTLPIFSLAIQSCSSEYFPVIYSGSADENIRVTTFRESEWISAGLFEGHRQMVTDLCSLPNMLISGSLDGTVRIWDSNSQKSLYELPLTSLLGESNNPVGVMSLACDDTKLLAGCTNGRILVFDLRRPGKILRYFTGHQSWVTGLFLEPQRIISSSRDRSIRIWEL